MACFLDVVVNSITGDCSNTSSGAFDISINGSAPDFTISWVDPNFGTIPLSGATGYTINGLSGGSYVFNVIDSCSGGSTTFPVSVYISTGTCVTITEVQNTTCNFNNGSLTADTTNYYNSPTFSLYELSSGFITSGQSFDNEFVFDTLSAGTYYVIADDGGGCTGKSETCIIKSSSTLDFGVYVINDAGCAVDSGAIYVTGATGVPPYTYLWSNGQTTPSITGLTPGNYNVIVTDSAGCSTSLGVVVNEVPPIGFGTFTVTNPSCNSSDGTVTLVTTGGTAPFYYSGSNGTVDITFATSYTFTGVAAGNFAVSVTDAGLCSFIASTVLLTPNSFTNVTISTTNSLCNNNTGVISISLFGGSPPYSYTLIDFTGNSATTVTNATNVNFNALESGVYTIQITDGGPCVFSQSVTINNTILYTLSSVVSGTTCGQNDGVVTLNISTGGTPPYIYQIDGASVNTSLSAYTFSGLASGNYNASVIDANLCQQFLPVLVPSSSSVNFILNPNQPFLGNDGSINTFILEGEPPFTLNWSSNVPSGQTGLTITGLTAGTYTLSVTDNNGCNQTRSVVLFGYNLISSYQVLNICDDNFTNSGQLIKKGLQQMLVEGFQDLTSGDTGCLLSAATFVCEVSVNGVTNSIGFYTSSSLNDFPPDSTYFNVVQALLGLYSELENITIDVSTGEILIGSICNPSIPYIDATIVVSVKIIYEINCVECAPPVVSPFIFEVDTTFTSMGSSASDEFQLPLDSGGTYDFEVDWGDGNVDVINTWNDPAVLHTYGLPDKYNITIKGQLSGWTFNDTGDKQKILSVQQWGILELGNVSGHFYGCSNLDLSGVTDFINLSTTNTLENTFRDCSTLTSINNVEFWDVSSVTNMNNIFNFTTFNQDIGSWDVSNVTDMSYMFINNTTFNQDISTWDVSNVVNMEGMFRGASSFNQDISTWNVSSVTNMLQMFRAASVFNQNINTWNVSNVTTMSAMFNNATSFNQPISGWNVSNVTTLANMFQGATSFNQNINNWDVSNVSSLVGMFNGATSFNQPLNSWNVSNVTTMLSTFNNSTSFNQPLSGWNVSGVTTMTGMFAGATTFNQDISTWDVSNVTQMNNMFAGTTSFNQNIGIWDVSSVTTMISMFTNATSFNQNLGNWDVSNVAGMNSMLNNCGIDQTNYESLLIGWNSLPSLIAGVNLGATGRQYQIGSAADTSRSNIIATYLWTITGDIAVP